MKDMSDNEFDRLFKEKSEGFDYEFEEEAWVLMEKKLRKKERIIFLRNLSIAACTLLFLAGGIFLYQERNKSFIAVKPGTVDSASLVAKSRSSNASKVSDPAISSKPGSNDLPAPNESSLAIVDHSKNNKGLNAGEQYLNSETTSYGVTADDNRSVRNTSPAGANDSLAHLDLLTISLDNVSVDSELSILARGNRALPSPDSSRPTKRSRYKPALSFTVSAGPDFSSTRSLAGKRGDLNAGLLINASWSSFTLSTGARYGVKKYDAEALDYALRNPARANEIYNIDASCNVLEIPLQLSIPVLSSKKRIISISGGLSSYLMLKEKYLFEYTPESGVNDFLLKKTNANQSYFGVAGFSARYTFKPTNQNIRFGLEPYVKLPLGGVGEGKVRLKSSGISLTMTYGTTKKH